MKFNNLIIYILFFVFLPLQCCSKVPKSKEVTSEVVEVEYEDSLESANDEEDIENEIETRKAKFYQIKKKPTFQFYRTSIDGDRVLVKESCSLSSGDFATSVYRTIIGKSPLQYGDINNVGADVFEREGIKYLSVNESEYELSEVSEVAFDMYSDLDYTITRAKSKSKLNPDDYWNDVTYN